MALVTFSDLRSRTNTLAKSLHKSVASIVRADSADLSQSYDIFLSHAKADEDVVLGAKQMLLDEGLSVYVDWIDDAQLDRSKVTADTAKLLRSRMVKCSCLLYLHSTNAPASNWMPWELGFFDGVGKKVGIFPVAERWLREFNGQEYLGLYPYLDYEEANNGSGKRFWIGTDYHTYAPLKHWVAGQAEIYRRPART